MAEPSPPKDPAGPRPLLSLGALAFMGAGAIGMLASFHYLSLSDSRDIAAGAAGFVAGAVLLGSGLITLAILSPRRP
jgi:hypothetical protein